jgi:predicted HD phosphohydrolase
MVWSRHGIAMAPEARAQRVLRVLQSSEGLGYIGESVSQLQHALQAAHFAARARASDEEILAALLHDVGHFCGPADAPAMEGLGVAGHEQIGAGWVRDAGLSAGVAELVRGHVQAKRYLVQKNPGYRARLSPASQRTLELQGGPMSQSEADQFERDPLFGAKLRLRQWDEQAKDPRLEVAPLASYRELLLRNL